MAGNTEIFDTLVSPDVKQQLADTTAGINALDAAFIKAAASANALNEATASSKSPSQFAKNAEASNAATQTIIANNEKTRLAEIKLQQAREKAFDDYEKKIQKQISDQQKAQQVANTNTQKQLDNQAKLDAANKKASEPFNQLKKAYQDSAQETGNLAVAQGKLSQAYLDSNEKTKALKSELDSIKQGYGDSTGSVGKYENALNRLGGILTSRVFRLAGTFLITDLVIKGTEALYKYIAALNIFNPIASAAEQSQAALDEAFKSADFTKGIEGLEKLNSSIDLQKSGFASADDVINQYNETIGKAYGNVDTLTAAQQGFIDNSKDYIRSIELEAAANILLGQTSAFTADILTKNQKLQDDIDDKSKARADFEKTKTTNPDYYNDQKQSVETSIANSIASDKKDIANNLQREQDYYNNSIKALDNFYVQRSDLNKKHGVPNGGNGGNDAIANLRNTVANQALEIDKQRQQAIIDNEDKSLSVRIAAVEKYGEDEKKIAENNYNNDIAGKKLSALEKEKIDNDLSIKEIDIQNATDKKIQELEKQRAEKAKADFNDQLKTIKENEEKILNAETSTYKMRIDAIAKFQTDSNNLINKAKKNKVITPGAATSLLGGIDNDAQTQTQQAFSKLTEKLNKELQEFFKIDKDNADKTVEALIEINDNYLEKLQQSRQDDIDDVNDLYKRGILDKQQYQDQLLKIEDDYNVKRLQKQLATDQAILVIRQTEYGYALSQAKGNDSAIPDSIKSAVSGAKAKVKTDKSDLSNAGVKQSTDNEDIARKEREEAVKPYEEGIKDASQIAQDASKAIQQEYQHEIDLLEAKKTLIQDTAQSEIDAVNGSILSEKDKQNKINVINKQAKAAQAQITNQENQIKNKQAKAQKEEDIVQATAKTALAVISTFAELGYPAGIVGAAIVAALGAAEIAVIAAQPLPKFEKGGLTAGGGLIWGERGMEMATLPGGERMFSPGSATYATMPKGTLITPHKDLMAQIGKSNYDRSDIGWREVVLALNRQKQPEQKRPYVKVNVYTDRSGLRR